MPELPEVETTRRGIAPHIEGHTVSAVRIGVAKLRWPVPELGRLLPGQCIQQVTRRAKYLLLDCSGGTLILHLGMSGSLRLLPLGTVPGKHDHFDLVFQRQLLRLRDPRKFGALLWTENDPHQHDLLRTLGPEPLSNAFNADYLYHLARTRKVAIKQLIMDGKVVVGVGNIYATEALFGAGIHPNRPCNKIGLARLIQLVDQIKQVLTRAIEQGGTTLRDFQHQDGQPGYFAQQLRVYGRQGEPCPTCGSQIKSLRVGQRSSAYCPRCQH